MVEGLSFIEYFYKKMAKPEPAPNSIKEKEIPNGVVEKNESNTGNSNEVLTSAPKPSSDIEITLDETEVSEVSPADTSNLGIEIVDTYTCSDSFIDELLNSPVKNKEDEKTVNDSCVSPEEEVIVANDILGSNIVDYSPISKTKANSEAQQERTTNSWEQDQVSSIKTNVEASKTVVSDIKDSTVPVVENFNKHVPDHSQPTKSSAIPTGTPIKPSEVPTKPSVLSSLKPKAGPRSKTKPNEPPVTRTSPTKIKESIAENIKIFEEAIKLKSHDDVLNKTNAEEDLTKRKSDKDETEDVEEEPTVKYRPGPKSRKKYLIVKEDDAVKDTKRESTKLSPKRTLEPSEDINTKKPKTKDVTLEESSNLDSTSSSTGSNLEIIDLDASDISSQATAVPKLDAVTEGTPERKLVTEKLSKDVEPTIIQETLAQANNPSTPAVVSKRASKRPFQCPVCQGFFRAEMVLQQHLAKIHFWNRLMALPRETNMGSGEMFQCSEFPCRYLHKSKTIVAGHIATEHKVVFTIALSIFPDFKLPILPVTRAVTTEDSVTIVGTVPGRLPPVEPTPTLDHPSKRSHSLARTDEEVNKKARPSALVRPVILPSQPTKAVTRVKPRTATALVQPIPSTQAESPLKPLTSQDKEKSYSAL